MNLSAWIQGWIHTHVFWHMISRYSSWSCIHIWIHITNSFQISWSWIHMLHFITYEFIWEFIYMKNTMKSYLISCVPRFQMHNLYPWLSSFKPESPAQALAAAGPPGRRRRRRPAPPQRLARARVLQLEIAVQSKLPRSPWLARRRTLLGPACVQCHGALRLIMKPDST